MQNSLDSDAMNLGFMTLEGTSAYAITQEKGEWRKFGPPRGWTGPAPAENSKIFIGCLPEDIFEDELFPVCQRHGTIFEICIRMSVTGEENRGYATITYTNSEAAEEAVQKLDDFQIDSGSRIRASMFTDKKQLFISNLGDVDNEKEFLKEVNSWAEGVSSIVLYESLGRYRDEAVIKYISHSKAKEAWAIFNTKGRNIVNRDGMIVDWALSEDYALELKNDSHTRETFTPLDPGISTTINFIVLCLIVICCFIIYIFPVKSE